VLMHWPESDALLRAKRASLQLVDGTSIECDIVRVRQSGRGFLVQFAGIGDLDAAQALRDARVLVARSFLPEVGPGEALLSDLVGGEVLGPDGTLIGRVVEIATYPSVDSIIIERVDGSRVEQPLVADWVEILDASPKRVALRSLDGLIGQ
jgi:16S rRNA processing protein RimM